jgi:1,4-alpha-glucan branching enzyme
MGQATPATSTLTDDDLHLFNEGSHFHLYEKLGSHPVTENGKTGVRFAVWAPNAKSVHVMGDFNEWSKSKAPLSLEGNSGLWHGFIPDIPTGACYKYHVCSKWNAYKVDKTDPFAHQHEVAPATGSVVSSMEYRWQDDEWMRKRHAKTSHRAPVSVYEVHLGSWRRDPENPDRHLSYREIAPMLVDYVLETGFTHVELLPVMEHPFYGSWGYQLTGFFAPSSRYGTPDDFAYLVDLFHQNNIGVILDWVPSHFPSDAHGLAFFDGTHLYEHEDPRQGYHPDWKSYIFNYGRHEVRSFLISSAFYWLDRFHIDGLRVDAVASMLYLDYSREAGEWIPNQHGGNENLEAITFLKRLNEEVYQHFPGVQMIAEESTAWPKVSRPLYLGGLGFGYKWDMGWMHDSLSFSGKDAVYRKHHHHQLTFRGLYAFAENYMLPLSHDEVVHGKGSLIEKMPGDNWQKFANLRLLFGNMFAQPAKKLLFMGGEFAQWQEWNHDASLDWHLLEHAKHRGMQQWIRDLNHTYRKEKALHVSDCEPEGFSWLDCDNADESIISWERIDPESGEMIVAIFNYTPVARKNYRVGVKKSGGWHELLNSDAPDYGGSGVGNLGGVRTADFGWHWRPYCITIALPPLAAVFFKHQTEVENTTNTA